GKKRDQSGLAGARRADEGDGSARLYVEVDAVQDAAALAIAEADILVADMAGQPRHGARSRPVGDVGLRGEKRQIALEAGNALGISLDDGIDLLDRPEEH